MSLQPPLWQERKISQSFRQIGSGTTPKSGLDVYYDNGTINWINTGDLNDAVLTGCKRKVTARALQDYSLKVYPFGSIIIAMYGATIGKVSISEINGCTNQACCVLNDSKTININFLFYWLLSQRDYIISLSYGGGQPNISQDTIKSLRVTSPSFVEQQAIAKYLNTKTAQIDRKIDLLSQKAEKYSKLKQSLINETVTRGLDKSVPMKDSQTEWQKELPIHWSEKRVKDLFKLITDMAPNNNNHELLSVYASIGVRPRKDLEQRGNKASSTDGYWLVKKGDIIVNKLLAWMGGIGLSEYDGVTSPAYDILRKTNIEVCERYYGYLFRTEKAKEIFKRHSRGIMDMRLRLYFDKFGGIKIAVPPLSE